MTTLDAINRRRRERYGLPPLNYNPSANPPPVEGPPTSSPAAPPGGAPTAAPPGGVGDVLGNVARYIGRDIQALGEPFQALTGYTRAIADTGPGQVLIPDAIQSVLQAGRAPEEMQPRGLPGSYQEAIEREQAEPLPAQLIGGALTDPTALAGGIGALRGVTRGIGSQAAQVAAGVAPGPTGTPPPAVSKLAELVRSAEPAIQQTKEMRHVELSRRVGRAAGIMEQNTGREAFTRGRSALAGQMPVAQYHPPQESLMPEEILQLHEYIKTAPYPKYGFLTKMDADDALMDILQGVVPQRSSLAKLEEIFNIGGNAGSTIAKAVLDKRPTRNKLWEQGLDALGLTRTLQASIDMSAPLRQGLILGFHSPDKWAQSFYKMVGSYRKEAVAQGVDDAIRNHPLFGTFEELGLYIAPRRGAGIGVATREEGYPSKWAQKIPGVKHSERAYTTFLNKLRFDVTKQVYEKWIKQGVDAATLAENTEKWVRFVNWSTGRGPLGRTRINRVTGQAEEIGLLADLGPVLNATFFAPRLLTGRVMLPFSMVGSSKAVNLEIGRTLGAFVGGGTALLTFLSMRDDVQVELDPRSSDWGKARVGSTRFDIWGGYQPLARTLTQMITGQRRSAGSGALSNVSRAGVLGRFIRGKFSPMAGLATDLVRGETFMGEDIGAPTERFGMKVHPVANTAIEQGLFLFAQDVLEAFDEEGLIAGIMTTPSFIGTGVQTFRTVEDVAQETYQRPFTELLPHEQRDVRAAHRLADPVQTPSPWDELQAEEDAAYQQMDDMAKGAFRTGKPTERRPSVSIESGRLGVPIIRRGTYATGGVPDAVRDVVSQFFEKRAELADKREGLSVGEQGGSFIDPMARPEQPNGGTETERAALEEYHGVADAATQGEGQLFDSDLYNGLLERMEQKWRREGTLEFVQASTHLEDIEAQYPALWRILPEKTRERYIASTNARTNIRRQREKQLR